jgi:hypothetical protein
MKAILKKIDRLEKYQKRLISAVNSLLSNPNNEEARALARTLVRKITK